MDMDDDVWAIVRHTPAVTGFVGSPGSRPVPLVTKEVAGLLHVPVEYIEVTAIEEQRAAAVEKAVAEIDLEIGETVRVTGGPFADFTGHHRRDQPRPGEAEGPRERLRSRDTPRTLLRDRREAVNHRR